MHFAEQYLRKALRRQAQKCKVVARPVGEWAQPTVICSAKDFM